jgi:hypothetical protein
VVVLLEGLVLKSFSGQAAMDFETQKQYMVVKLVAVYFKKLLLFTLTIRALTMYI